MPFSTTPSQLTSSNRTSGLYYGMQQERRGINIDDGPPSLPISSMPPLRDNNYSSNNSNHNTPSTFQNSASYFNLSGIGGSNHNTGNSNSSSRSMTSPFSGSPIKPGAIGHHTTQMSSPSRLVCTDYEQVGRILDRFDHIQNSLG